MEHLVGQAIGQPAERISIYNRFKGQAETTTRLFAADMTSKPGHGLWIGFLMGCRFLSTLDVSPMQV